MSGHWVYCLHVLQHEWRVWYRWSLDRPANAWFSNTPVRHGPLPSMALCPSWVGGSGSLNATVNIPALKGLWL